MTSSRCTRRRTRRSARTRSTSRRRRSARSRGATGSRSRRATRRGSARSASRSTTARTVWRRRSPSTWRSWRRRKFFFLFRKNDNPPSPSAFLKRYDGDHPCGGRLIRANQPGEYDVERCKKATLLSWFSFILLGGDWGLDPISAAVFVFSDAGASSHQRSTSLGG